MIAQVERNRITQFLTFKKYQSYKFPLKSLKQFQYSTEKVEMLKGVIIYLFRLLTIANALMVVV